MFTPEILSLSQKMRKIEYQRYLHELIDLNKEGFSNAPDVTRGLESLS